MPKLSEHKYQQELEAAYLTDRHAQKVLNALQDPPSDDLLCLMADLLHSAGYHMVMPDSIAPEEPEPNPQGEALMRAIRQSC